VLGGKIKLETVMQGMRMKTSEAAVIRFQEEIAAARAAPAPAGQHSAPATPNRAARVDKAIEKFNRQAGRRKQACRS
jgi:hypothetical protein